MITLFRNKKADQSKDIKSMKGNQDGLTNKRKEHFLGDKATQNLVHT